MINKQEDNTLAQWIQKQFDPKDIDELMSKDPTIVSCGGIYIPHSERQKRHFYIINCAANDHPIRVFADNILNPLRNIISKESKN